MFKPQQPPLININAPIVGVTTYDLVTSYCVYEVWQETTLIFIGVCNFSALAKLPDAKSNGAFSNMIAVDTPISVVVKHIGTRIACYNRRAEMIRQLTSIPVCNKWAMNKEQVVIKCNEDGKTYKTQTECAHAYGISTGNLSSHLRGKPGVLTLAGRTFSRVVEVKP